MKHTFQRQLVLTGVILALTMACWAGQNKLASIMIGMSPQQVKAKLGEPTGILQSQPPIIPNSSFLSDAAREQADGNLPEIFERLPAVMVYRYKKDGRWVEHEVDTGISMLSSQSPGTGRLPTWAYPVRVGYLGLDQQEYLYRINSTYSVGVVFTGEGAESRVTDIIAASVEPFVYTKVDDDLKKVPMKQKLDMFYAEKKLDLSAGTTLGVTLGSSFSRMLQKHGWPEVFLPFVTDQAVEYQLFPTPEVKDVSPLSGRGVGTGEAGIDPVRIYDPNNSFSLVSGFSDNFMLLYVKHGVAATVVNMTVVRLQIGQGVVQPPTPPKVEPKPQTDKPASSSTRPSTPPTSMPPPAGYGQPGMYPPGTMPPPPGGSGYRPGGYPPPGVGYPPPGGYPPGMQPSR